MKATERRRGIFWGRLFRTAAVAAVWLAAGGRPAEPQGWVEKTVGRLTFNLPPDWKAMDVEDAAQKVWYRGDLENPEVIFSVFLTTDVNEILSGLNMDSKGAVTVGGKGAVKFVGSPKEGAGKGVVFVLDEKEAGGNSTVIIGAFHDDASWNAHRSVFDRIVASIRIKGGAAAPSCVWDSFTMDPRQFAAQPGGVFPMRRNYKSGRYLVHVGPAGKDGLAVPPSVWRTFGPFDIAAGDKYAAIIRKGAGTVCELDWEKNSSRLLVYGNPPADRPGLEGHAVVYVRNDHPDAWYAICLEPVGAPAGAPELQLDSAALQTLKAGGTVTLRAKATHIPPDVKRVKFSWYVHMNECVSSDPPGNKANFWYIQFVDVRNGEAEGSIVMKAAAAKGESSFSLMVQDEPNNKKVFLSTKTMTYQIQ